MIKPPPEKKSPPALSTSTSTISTLSPIAAATATTPPVEGLLQVPIVEIFETGGHLGWEHDPCCLEGVDLCGHDDDDSFFGGLEDVGKAGEEWIEEVLQDDHHHRSSVALVPSSPPQQQVQVPQVPRLFSLWFETKIPEIEGVSIHDGFFELESLVTNMSLGLAPQTAPFFMRRLAAADGGLVHSRRVTAVFSAVHMRTSLRFFAIDVLKSGLSTPGGRALAKRALASTRFASATDGDLGLIYQQLLVPETVLSVDEMKRFLHCFSGDELRSLAPGLIQVVKTHLHLPCLGRSLVQMVPMPKKLAIYDGEQCPAHMVEIFNREDGHALLVDSKICQIMISALRLGDPQLPRKKSLSDAVEELSEDLLRCLTINNHPKFDILE